MPTRYPFPGNIKTGKQLYHTHVGRLRTQSRECRRHTGADSTEKRVLRPETLPLLPLRIRVFETEIKTRNLFIPAKKKEVSLNG